MAGTQRSGCLEHAVALFDWFDTGIIFKDCDLVYSKSFKINRQQTYGGVLIYMLNGWDICSYMTVPFLAPYMGVIFLLLEPPLSASVNNGK